jgi:hypothetical protein
MAHKTIQLTERKKALSISISSMPVCVPSPARLRAYTLANAVAASCHHRRLISFRLGAYGPCEICDQAGLDTYYAVYKYLYGKLKKEHFAPCSILKGLVEEGRLGLKNKSGFYEYKEDMAEKIKRQRDRKLYRRLRFLREEMKAESKG